MSATLFTCSELRQQNFLIEKADLEASKDNKFGVVLNKYCSKHKSAKEAATSTTAKFAIKTGSNIVKLMSPNDVNEFLDKYAPIDELTRDDISVNEILENASKDLEGVYISRFAARALKEFNEDYIKDLGERIGVRILNKDCLQEYTGPDMEVESLRKVTLTSEQKRCLADFEDADIQAELEKELQATSINSNEDNSEYSDPLEGSENWWAEIAEDGRREREARGEAPPTITVGGVEIGGTNSTTSTQADTTTNPTTPTPKEFDLGRRATGRIANFMNNSAKFFTKLGINFDKNANDFGKNVSERKENIMKSLNTLKTNISNSFSDFSYQITKRWDDLGSSVKSMRNPFTRSEKTEVNNQAGTINLNIFNFSSADISDELTNQIKNSIVREEKKLINVANFQSSENGSIGMENAALSLFIGKDNQIFLGNLQIAGLND